MMAAEELDEYLALGNIRNSVNYPAASMPKSGVARICVLHANVPAVLSGISGACGAKGINIENMLNKSRGDNAYTMLDVAADIGADVLATIEAIEGVRRVRVIKF